MCSTGIITVNIHLLGQESESDSLLLIINAVAQIVMILKFLNLRWWLTFTVAVLYF